MKEVEGMSIYRLRYSDVGDPPFRYTTSNPVPGTSDNIEIMLVQYYLTVIFNDEGPYPDGKPLDVDGIFGPRTARWIRAYQLRHKSRGSLISTDGVVTPAFDKPLVNPRAPQSAMSKSGRWYTMIWMGWDYAQARRKQNKPVDLTSDQDAPAVLRQAAEFARNWDSRDLWPM